jgi:hypothetical protein
MTPLAFWEKCASLYNVGDFYWGAYRGWIGTANNGSTAFFLDMDTQVIGAHPEYGYPAKCTISNRSAKEVTGWSWIGEPPSKAILMKLKLTE